MQEKSKKLLCKYLQYIKECIERPDSGVNKTEIICLLKASAMLITNKGIKLVTEGNIHFHSEFSPSTDVVKMFPGKLIDVYQTSDHSVSSGFHAEVGGSWDLHTPPA